MTDAGPLPEFPYHPDPLATVSVAASDTACVCCGLRRGHVYTGPVFAVADGLDDALCPWCLADGTAAERYEAQFTGLRAFPDASEFLAAEFDEAFLGALDAEGQPTAYLFRCRHCARHLAYADFS